MGREGLHHPEAYGGENLAWALSMDKSLNATDFQL